MSVALGKLLGKSWKSGCLNMDLSNRFGVFIIILLYVYRRSHTSIFIATVILYFYHPVVPFHQQSIVEWEKGQDKWGANRQGNKPIYLNTP